MQRTNVLFIAVDDLRTSLGCYGDRDAITPNMDRLAARGVIFSRAYCQQAVCNPSRASLMTGLRPDTIKVWDLKSHFRQELPEELKDLPQHSTGTHFREAAAGLVTLPQHFMKHGYHAQSVGKVYHGSPLTQDPESWSVPAVLSVADEDEGLNPYLLPQNQHPDMFGGKMASSECVEVADEAYPDGKVAREAINVLREIKDRPFFLAVGFRKPHLPWCAPKRYWDYYDRGALAPPANAWTPDAVPGYALHNSRELRGYRDIPSDGPLPNEKIMELRHAYYAATSFMDAQFGKVLDELDRLGLAENTAVLLYGDHGYHLGEKELWCKTTNYELDTNAPLILSAPGRTTPGTQIDALVEFVDVYPTLAELCGLPVSDGLEGISMASLLDDPNRDWKTAAFSQFPRPWFYRGDPGVMGYTVKTDTHRYTEWQDFRTAEVKARELYDHRHDPGEMHNLADRPGHGETVTAMREILRGGWTAALPPGTEGRAQYAPGSHL